MKPQLNISIDPRKTPFALVPCPVCPDQLEITHKMLRLHMWRQSQVTDMYPDLPSFHERVQLMEITCASCRTTFVLTYDFEEFAMSAYAFTLRQLISVEPTR